MLGLWWEQVLLLWWGLLLAGLFSIWLLLMSGGIYVLIWYYIGSNIISHVYIYISIPINIIVLAINNMSQITNNPKLRILITKINSFSIILLIIYVWLDIGFIFYLLLLLLLWLLCLLLLWSGLVWLPASLPRYLTINFILNQNIIIIRLNIFCMMSWWWWWWPRLCFRIRSSW